MAVVEAVEGSDEVDGCGGEVHDEVVYCLGDGENCRGRRGDERSGTTGAFGGDGDGVLGGSCEVEEVVGSLLNEFVAVFAEGADEILDLGLCQPRNETDVLMRMRGYLFHRI